MPPARVIPAGGTIPTPRYEPAGTPIGSTWGASASGPARGCCAPTSPGGTRRSGGPWRSANGSRSSSAGSGVSLWSPDDRTSCRPIVGHDISHAAVGRRPTPRQGAGRKIIRDGLYSRFARADPSTSGAHHAEDRTDRPRRELCAAPRAGTVQRQVDHHGAPLASLPRRHLPDRRPGTEPAGLFEEECSRKRFARWNAMG